MWLSNVFCIMKTVIELEKYIVLLYIDIYLFKKFMIINTTLHRG